MLFHTLAGYLFNLPIKILCKLLIVVISIYFMLQTTLTIMLNCLSYIHYVQHLILFIPAYHYSDKCNNFLVCHLLCFMFNHLKHNLKVVQDCITLNCLLVVKITLVDEVQF